MDLCVSSFEWNETFKQFRCTKSPLCHIPFNFPARYEISLSRGTDLISTDLLGSSRSTLNETSYSLSITENRHQWHINYRNYKLAWD